LTHREYLIAKILATMREGPISDESLQGIEVRLEQTSTGVLEQIAGPIGLAKIRRINEEVR
jgi:hypothetical protein